APPKRELRLEVEADYHHEAGRVGIRFYALEDGRRQLLKLGNVHMYAGDLQHEKRKNLRSWPEKDQEFLKWVIAAIRKGAPRNHDLLMLNLDAEEFLTWRKRWSGQPQRFLNRDTQQAIPPPGPVTPARLIVELSKQNECFRITPFFIFPDGRRRQPYEIMRQLENDPNRIEVRRQLLAWSPPITWPVLNHWFSSKPLLLEPRQFISKLSEILQGRLDLLEGDCVKKISSTAADAELYADFQQGKFQISCGFQGNKVSLRGEWVPVSRIEADGNGFQVLYTAPDEQALLLREKLLALGKRLGQIQECQVLLEGTLKNAAELKAFWKSLPATAIKHHAASLQGLLQDDAALLTTQLNLRGEGGLLELGVHWQLGGTSIPAEELQTALRYEQSVMHLSNGHWLAFDPDRARLLLQKMEEEGISPGETLPLLRHQAAERIRQLTANGLASLGAGTASFYERLCRDPRQEAMLLPEALEPVLRSYQKSGFDFLADRCLHGAGCILADDMGLGKTLQVLSFLYAAQKRVQQAGGDFLALVICPATVMNVWKAQAGKFVPGLRVEVWEGNKKERERIFHRGSFDLLVTHYGMVRQEQDLLNSREYDFLVLDEAQAIKNPAAQVTQAVKAICAKHKLALTGTPMENRILDLWSIMDCLNPKFFGAPDDFVRLYSGNPAALRKRLSLLLLRRSKALVASELPPRIVEVLPVELSEQQRDLYDRTLLATRKAVKEYGAIQILAGLTKLRQICCDPELILKEPLGECSGKLAVLLEKLSELVEAGHSALVFSQFTSMLDLIAPRLRDSNIPFWTITGETPLPRRGELVEEFSNDERPGVFLLSLKAAGTGLTLTKADYVFLYDPWWNPAVENQAIDRTHRLGQDKTVMAYRLVAKDSIEERVLALMEQKRELFDAVIGEGAEQGVPGKLTREDLLQLLA
ncbi:MAG: DEAD/DEAH box helicase, partial [Lentisphaeria bacterium]|nr:DEAD/DEAH box helicase [Lentisphaeria bacterium]